MNLREWGPIDEWGADVTPWSPRPVFIDEPFSPSDVDGLILWLDPALDITLNGADVSAWGDQSAGGNDAVQGTAVDQPFFNATGWSNGLPTVDFDLANTEWMDLTGLVDTSNDYTAFAVMDKLTDSTVEQLLTEQNSALQIANERTTGVGLFDGVWKIFGTTALGEQALTWHLDNGGNASEVYRDGVSIGTDTFGAHTISGTVTLGAAVGGGSQWADMQLGELLVYNRALTTDELADVHAYLTGKFDL